MNLIKLDNRPFYFSLDAGTARQRASPSCTRATNRRSRVWGSKCCFIPAQSEWGRLRLSCSLFLFDGLFQNLSRLIMKRWPMGGLPLSPKSEWRMCWWKRSLTKKRGNLHDGEHTFVWLDDQTFKTPSWRMSPLGYNDLHLKSQRIPTFSEACNWIHKAYSTAPGVTSKLLFAQQRYLQELQTRGDECWISLRWGRKPCYRGRLHSLVEDLGFFVTWEVLQLQRLLGEEGDSQVEVVVPQLVAREGRKEGGVRRKTRT